MKIREMGTGEKGEAMNNNGQTPDTGAVVYACVFQAHCSILDQNGAKNHKSRNMLKPTLTSWSKVKVSLG